MDTEKKCELSFILPNLCILDASQEASQNAGITVNLGQRVCWVPAVWLGNPVCCIDHLFQRELIWKAMESWLWPHSFIGWREKVMENVPWKNTDGSLVLNPWWPKEVDLTVWSQNQQHQHHLGTCEKSTVSWGGLTTDWLNQKLQRESPTIYVLRSPPGGFGHIKIWELLAWNTQRTQGRLFTKKNNIMMIQNQSIIHVHKLRERPGNHNYFEKVWQS